MLLDQYKNSIIKLCEQNNVKHLFVFGSVLTQEFTGESDIDFLVDIKSTDPIEYAENYFNLKFQLEDLFNRQIDLLEEKGLKNPFLIENINRYKKLIYEA